MSLETISTVRSHGGTQGVYQHASSETGTPMTFSVFVPDHLPGTRLPVLWYLSGLTCTQANVTEKGEFRQACSERGIVLVAPDTSPRGDGVPDDAEGAYDFGLGAGFYVDATEAPFAANYRMFSYVADELPALIAAEFPVDPQRQSITGHSMGGHGALILALSRPDQFKSVSAFSPIVAPSEVPWGQKALTGYLGTDCDTWRRYDAVALVEDGARVPAILIDQGTADQFLAEQLQPERLVAACDAAGIPVELRMQAGYDHSYYFISTFLADHVRWHADRLM
ncbi:S-formylglutathione hydrolase [Sphingomonas sp. CFBP 13603]|uniref:S-formylglutathione hydrolase n=1 Tax=Sphingomonas sp. CFBP 13603 TaxID=2774040 RepID=UPI00186769A6|nr:S-formylglutathione hydrolase [Sphingomonas sp. CFBP 13603]MBE2992283.1 S-formylglutathione hydrolase [Sphingomonas sp. CFBP 13603]